MSLVAVPMQPDAQAIESDSFEGLQLKMMPERKVTVSRELLDKIKPMVREAVKKRFG
jgi:hypothetical protein